MEDAGFLLPMTSSGNIVFTDAALLEAELNKSAIAPYIEKTERVKLE